ncbi:MAG: phosphatase PAP2 family protein [Proteobacteria bacterium]|nr:phosphatase PAP2 family protein [Pseudomonadota bacterium]
MRWPEPLQAGSPLAQAFERLLGYDLQLCLRMNRAAGKRWVLAPLRAVSRVGDGVFWYVLMLTLLFADRTTHWPVVHMAVAGLACTLLYRVLKRCTLRPRPYQVHPRVVARAAPLDHFSFPSGHTMHAVAFTLVCLAYYPALAWLLVPFTLLVAVSRVVLGLHYPSDVLAGALLGAIIAILPVQLA